MKLSKAFIGSLKSEVFRLISPFSYQYVPNLKLIQEVSTLFGHIEELEKENTELSQENLQKREEVNELVLQGNKHLNDMATLNKNNKYWRDKLAERSEQCLDLSNEEAALSQELEFLKKERQPVPLTQKQVTALDRLMAEGLDNYTTITFLATHTWNQSHAQHFREIWDMDRNVLVNALVNGYIAQSEPVVTIEEEIASMIHAWATSPEVNDIATECLVIATKIVEHTKCAIRRANDDEGI